QQGRQAMSQSSAAPAPILARHHAAGPWRSVCLDQDGAVVVRRRRHRLGVVIPGGAIDQRWFSPISCINSAAFLGVAAGALLCRWVRLFRAAPADDRLTVTRERGVTRDERRRCWRLVFCLEEQQPWGWDLLPWDDEAGGY